MNGDSLVPRAERFNPDAFKKDVIWGHLTFMYAASPPWVPEAPATEDRDQSRARSRSYTERRPRTAGGHQF